MFNIQPITLTGKLVRVEPLTAEFAEDLFELAQDQDIWTYIPSNPSLSLATMHSWIAEALRYQQAGEDLPFVIRDLASGRLCGATRYMDILPDQRGLEIGNTWLGASARRTGINTECKYLLLCHAFETLGAIRVQLKTDSRNLRSQNAIERIGGVREGILRNHKILPDGYYRHSVYFSIIESEWPDVKERLLRLMAQ